VPGVGEDVEDQRTVGIGQERGDLPVEVGRETVPDVGLDQSLQPGAGAGALVEGVERGDERGHRVGRVHAELRQPIGESHVMRDLGCRHPGQRRAAAEGGGEPGVLGQPVEGGQFRVGEHPEQVDDGSTVDRGHGHLLGWGGRSADGPRGAGEARRAEANRCPRYHGNRRALPFAVCICALTPLDAALRGW
jgi:hypothetical protein